MEVKRVRRTRNVYSIRPTAKNGKVLPTGSDTRSASCLSEDPASNAENGAFQRVREVGEGVLQMRATARVLLTALASLLTYGALILLSWELPGSPTSLRLSADPRVAAGGGVPAAHVHAVATAVAWYERAVLPALAASIVGAVVSRMALWRRRDILWVAGAFTAVLLAMYGLRTPAPLIGGFLFLVCLGGGVFLTNRRPSPTADARV